MYADNIILRFLLYFYSRCRGRPNETNFHEKTTRDLVHCIWFLLLLQSSSFSRSTKPKAPTISDQLTWAPGCNRGSHEGPSRWGFLIRKKCNKSSSWVVGILACWVRLSEHNQQFQSIQSSTSSSTIFLDQPKKSPPKTEMTPRCWGILLHFHRSFRI